MNSCPILPATGAGSLSFIVVCAALLVIGGGAIAIARRSRAGVVVLALVAVAAGSLSVVTSPRGASAAMDCSPTTTTALFDPTTTQPASGLPTPTTPSTAGSTTSTTIPTADPTTTTASATTTTTMAATTTTTTAPSTTSTTSTTSTSTTSTTSTSTTTTSTTTTLPTGPDFAITVENVFSRNDQPNDTSTNWLVTFTEVNGFPATGPIVFTFPPTGFAQVGGSYGGEWTADFVGVGVWQFTSVRTFAANEVVELTLFLNSPPATDVVAMSPTITTGSAGDTNTANNSASASVIVTRVR